MRGRTIEIAVESTYPSHFEAKRMRERPEEDTQKYWGSYITLGQRYSGKGQLENA